MYLAVKKVQPTSDYQLILTFSNGEIRQFDMNPYLQTGIFQELKDIALFNSVKVSFDTIEWDNEADMDPEILYKESIVIEHQIASEPTSDYGLDK
jgi:hypothetical protein